MVRLLGIGGIIKQSGSWLCGILDKQCDGYFIDKSNFILNQQNMTEEQGINIIERCMNSLKERFVMSQSSFTVKVITKDGIKVIRAPEIPKGGAWFELFVSCYFNSKFPYFWTISIKLVDSKKKFIKILTVDSIQL